MMPSKYPNIFGDIYPTEKPENTPVYGDLFSYSAVGSANTLPRSFTKLKTHSMYLKDISDNSEFLCYQMQILKYFSMDMTLNTNSFIQFRNRRYRKFLLKLHAIFDV